MGVILGLSGKARAGKDTAADFILNNRPGWQKHALADPLKRICRDVFRFSLEQLYGHEKDAPDGRYRRKDGQPLTPRYAMQTLGTDWGRDCHPDVWVDMLLHEAESLFAWNKPPILGVVVSDVRFVNEALAIRAAGGKLWRIRRPTVGLEGAAAEHASETDLDVWLDELFDDVIENDSTLGAFERRVLAALSGLSV